jgi:YesN/AraC family two-component response regulator
MHFFCGTCKALRKMSATCSEPAVLEHGERLPRVLLVDDSVTARDGLASLLRSSFTVHIAGEAADGPKGLEMAALLQPDLVITDLQMPGFDGFALVDHLRRDYPEMRTIVVSANEGSVWQRLSVSHGADAFISKRRIPKELAGVLQRLFPAVSEKSREKNL